MKQIDSITLERLANGAHFSLMKRLIEAAEADSKVSEKASTQLAKLKTSFAQEDVDLKISQKSLDTDKIKDADSRQDKLYTSLKRAVKGFLGDSDSEIAEAAKVINQALVDYAIDTKMQLDREAGLVTNLCGDLADKYSEQVATLGISVMVKRLTDANNEVQSYLGSRSMEQSTKVAGALKKSRAQVDTDWRDFVLYVNAAAVIYGIADYESYIDYANTEINRIKQQALGQKSTTSTDDNSSSSGNGGSSSSGNGGSSSNGNGGSSSSGSGSSSSDEGAGLGAG